MPTGNAAIPHFSDSTPSVPTGQRNSKWQQGSPYSGTLVWNGQNYTVDFTDISVNFPNVGGLDARTTTSETIGLSSQGKLVTLSNASPIAGTLDSSVPNYFLCAVKVIGAGGATLTPSSGTIDGASSKLLASNEWAFLFFNGTNWWTLASGGGTDTDYYQTVEEAGTSRTQRSSLNFLAPVTATDNSGNNSTDIAVSVMVGDGGSGGVKGLAPAPGAGDAAAQKYLKADGTYQVPTGTGTIAAPYGADVVPTSPDSTDDEFNSGTLNANWGNENGGPGSGSGFSTRQPGWYRMVINLPNSQWAGFSQTAPSGSWAYETSVSLGFLGSAPTEGMVGIWVVRGDGGVEAVALRWGDSGAPTNGLANKINARGEEWNSYTSFSAQLGVMAYFNTRAYLRIEWDATDTANVLFNTYYSTDGLSWVRLNTTNIHTQTASKIAFGTRASGTDASLFYFDWFRKRAIPIATP